MELVAAVKVTFSLASLSGTLGSVLSVVLSFRRQVLELLRETVEHFFVVEAPFALKERTP